MGQLSRSVSRFFRGLVRIISFGFIKMSEPLEKSPEMIGMRYEDVIAKKAKAAKDLKNSIGDIMGEQEVLKSRAKTIANDIETLKEEQEGAQVLAKDRLEELMGRGMSQEDALKDEEFLSYQSAYNDATSTLSAKEENLADLEARVESMQQSVTDYTLQAQELAREVDQLRSERHEAEADARLSKEFDSINESLAGISTSGADHDLVELRRDVAKSRGRAKASAKIAKVDVSTQRAKLREAARSKVSNKEFLKSIGVETTPTKITPSSPSKEKASETPPQQQAQPELND